jgi:hypothetical protein
MDGGAAGWLSGFALPLEIDQLLATELPRRALFQPTTSI